MNKHQDYSDEFLNAFIDNQLDKSERAALLNALRNDRDLSRRVCELEKVRSLVQLGYQSVPVPDTCQDKASRIPSNRLRALAASLLLGLGIALGWYSNTELSRPSLLELARQAEINQAVSTDSTWNLMLHVSTADPRRLDILLDETEALLKEYQQSGKQLNLEILANSQGLKLVSDNGEPYSQRLNHILQLYHNVAALACNKTLQRMREESGKAVELHPSTEVVPSALHQIIKRQREGWTYVHI